MHSLRFQIITPLSKLISYELAVLSLCRRHHAPGVYFPCCHQITHQRRRNCGTPGECVGMFNLKLSLFFFLSFARLAFFSARRVRQGGYWPPSVKRRVPIFFACIAFLPAASRKKKLRSAASRLKLLARGPRATPLRLR